jgi:Tfp pilus assembly protein PilN
MPLPQQVVEQLGRGETSDSQGWAWDALLFSGGMLFLVVAIYVGLKFGSETYWNNQLTTTQNAVTKASASVSPADQAQIVSFYSQTANLKSALANHQFTSKFFSWLENNTEANVYYQTFQLSAGGKVTLKGAAKTEADVNQQIAIFENAASVTSVALSGVSVAQTGGGFIFNVALTMSPSVFAGSSL